MKHAIHQTYKVNSSIKRRNISPIQKASYLVRVEQLSGLDKVAYSLITCIRTLRKTKKSERDKLIINKFHGKAPRAYDYDDTYKTNPTFKKIRR